MVKNYKNGLSMAQVNMIEENLEFLKVPDLTLELVKKFSEECWDDSEPIWPLVREKLKYMRSDASRYEHLYNDFSWLNDLPKMVINEFLTSLWCNRFSKDSQDFKISLYDVKTDVPDEYIEDLGNYIKDYPIIRKKSEEESVLIIQRAPHWYSIYIRSENWFERADEEIKNILSIADVEKNILTESIMSTEDKVRRAVTGEFKNIYAGWKSRCDDLYMNMQNYKKGYSDALKTYTAHVKIKPDSETFEKNFIEAAVKYVDKGRLRFINPRSAARNASYIYFLVKSPIFNFDEKSAKNALEGCREFDPIFIDRKYDYWLDTPIMLNLSSGHTSRFLDDRYINDTLTSYYKDTDELPPNPHIAFYDCFGQNALPLSEIAIQGRYDEYFMCLFATVGNLNFGDRVVTDKFVYQYLSKEQVPDNMRPIERLSDGKFLTVKEYLNEIA